MPKLHTFLTYDGCAEEAARFYVSIFKNASIKEVIPGREGSALTATFVLDGQEFVSLDGGPRFQFSEAISLSISCDSQDEIDYYWAKLSEGGTEQACGWLKDKFGVSWQVTYSGLPKMFSDPRKRDAVMTALEQMVKTVVAKLEDAFRD